MKQSFEIYPALLVISPRRENKFSGYYYDQLNNEQNQYKETDNGHDFTGPHVHYGDCVVNAAHTLVTLYLGKEIGTAPQLDLTDSLLGQLKTETLHGKQYVITFVPVMN